MDEIPPLISNGVQLIGIYVCPLFAILWAWIGGARTMRKLAIAGAKGGVVGAVVLFVFLHATLTAPWWTGWNYFTGTPLMGASLGATVAIIAFLIRRRREL